MEILLLVLNYLLPVIAAILTIIAPVLVKKLLDKWGIERSERIDAMIDKYVGIGVNAAEVAGRKYLLANHGGMSSDDKKAKAIKVVMDELKQAGVTGVATDLVSSRIESWLEDKGHKPGGATPE